VARFVQLRLLSHHHFSIEQTSFVDHQLRRSDIPFDDCLSLEHNFLRRNDRASHFSADRDVFRRHISIDLTRDPDRQTFARGDLAGDFPIDTNIPLTSDLPFDDSPRADQVEFFDRISFQSLSSFRS
jgi:hypothetical protein